MRCSCIVGEPSVNANRRALKSLAVPAALFMDGTWTDAVEAAMGLRARDSQVPGG
jgi:hypothetical protein